MTFTNKSTNILRWLGIVGMALLVLLFSPNSTSAQATCTITSISNVWSEEAKPELEYKTESVECTNPFGLTPERQGTAVLRINGQTVESNDTITLVTDATPNISITPTPGTETWAAHEVHFYRHDGDNYILDNNNDNPLNTPGTYTAVIEEYDLQLNFNDSFFDTIRSFFIPTAYAQNVPGSVRTLITFTVTNQIPTPPLSPLLLKYEPILRFHENEDYFPMNVEAFVEGSGLWDSAGLDENIIPRSPVNVPNGLTLDYLATTTDTKSWYIAFSSDEAGTINLDEARERYSNLKDNNIAVPTYYAAQTEDSYKPFLYDETTRKNFIVLQYWYFYAMNNWQDKNENQNGNNHEGDWESVFLFLDKDTEEPEYVAFSAHHNDGDLKDKPKSVRRNWSDVEKKGNQVVSYVSVGSHAVYPVVGEVKYKTTNAIDRTSGNGIQFNDGDWQKRILLDEGWTDKYEGLFGANQGITSLGGSGTQGPKFTNVSGTKRYHNPIEWAGLDFVTRIKINKEQNDEARRTIELKKQKVKLHFEKALEIGTDLSVGLYEEIITFGNNISETNLLPMYWEFDLNKENSTFNVDVTLSYSEEYLDWLGVNENVLGIYYYDEANDFWQSIDSVVDVQNRTITFTTDHFSIYTIGVNYDIEEINVENEVVENNQIITSQSTKTNRYKNRVETQVLGINYSNNINELIFRVKELEGLWRGGVLSDYELLLELLVVLERLSTEQ